MEHNLITKVARALGNELRQSEFPNGKGRLLDIRQLTEPYWNVVLWRNGRIIVTASGKLYRQVGVALIPVRPTPAAKGLIMAAFNLDATEKAKRAA